MLAGKPTTMSSDNRLTSSSLGGNQMPADCRVPGNGVNRSAPPVRARRGLALVLLLVATLAMTVAAAARPIPPGRGMNKAVQFYGKPAIAKPVAMQQSPQNPYMAAGDYSNIHNNSYMTDSYRQAGPLGREMAVTSVRARGECASITFTSKGEIVAICLLPGKPAYLTLMNPDTLRIITRTALPSAPAPALASSSPSTRDYTELSGGYFYLDHLDRAVVATATRHLITYRIVRDGASRVFTPVSDVDLTGVVAEGDVIESALPDFDGNIWFVTLKDGKVGYVDRVTQTPQVMTLGTTAGDEGIANSFAMGADGGIYIVSTKAMYRFDVATFPVPTWRTVYENAGTQKSGQKSIGSGTTPTIMPRNRVAIVDNAAPREHIVVYDTNTGVEVCSEAVFPLGRSATENSLISVNNSLIVENNYGNDGAQSTTLGRTTTPGMTRVDVSAAGECTTVWENTSITVPSVVSKFSAGSGLIYTYSKPKGPGTTDRWYWTAIDYRTGAMVYSKLAGTGAMFNNDYASLYLGPTGAGYVGVLGGLIRVSDGTGS
jgi:hypothetical protein